MKQIGKHVHGKPIRPKPSFDRNLHGDPLLASVFRSRQFGNLREFIPEFPDSNAILTSPIGFYISQYVLAYASHLGGTATEESANANWKKQACEELVRTLQEAKIQELSCLKVISTLNALTNTYMHMHHQCLPQKVRERWT